MSGLRISEIFYSIQGEGTLAGVPSVFVRVSGCNLRCVWCDTPYTSWSPEGEIRSVDQVREEVEQHTGAHHVVITGGEPMLFEAVSELAAALRDDGFHITVETAGTVYRDVVCDLMSISPKLANSTPWLREAGRFAASHESARYRPEVLRQLMESYPYQLKFVVASQEDLPEIRRIVEETRAERERILLMPEGTQPVVVAERGRWIAELCKEQGWRYSPRLHVELWGDQRGR
jgi:7-carboxy-7-deazaguanine synthase